jgi:hypothetical protein
MFDNTQTTKVECIDERFLPASGVIVLWKLTQFCGKNGAFTSIKEKEKYLEELIDAFTEHSIPLIKIGNDKFYWLVRLEDIRIK